MEGFKKLEGKKVSLVEIGTLVAALIGAVDATPAHALEIEPSTSWHNGISENIRQSALKESVEHGAVYVQFGDNSGMWLPVSSGETKRLDMNMREVQRQARSMGKIISNICVLHTHPIEINRTSIKIPGVASESIPIAPSSGDIANANSKSLIPTGNTFTFGAADGLGIWYFSGGKTLEVPSTPNVQKFGAEYKDFIIKSTKGDFNLQAELPKLQEAYRMYLNGEVRFVPYDQIEKEPPCAGVHGPTMIQTKSDTVVPRKVQKSESVPQGGQGVVSMDFSQPIKSFRPPQ